MRKIIDFLPAAVMFGTRPNNEQIYERVGSSCSYITCLDARSFCSFFLMIVGFWSAEVRLSDKIKALERPLYPNSAPKQRIIGRCFLKLLDLGYFNRKQAQALGFSGDGNLINGGYDALASLNLMEVLGLGRAKRHENERMNL